MLDIRTRTGRSTVNPATSTPARPSMPNERLRANRVLVVDEEEPLTNLLTLTLQFQGWEVETLANGGDAVAVARRFRPDAILMDMMLPDVNGVQVVQTLRENDVTAPVIFLTGRDSLEDRLAAFGAGGDDYMTKPFGLDEVTARLRSVFRRSGLLPTSVVYGDIVLDTHTEQVWRAGEQVLLTNLETRILEILVERAGEPIDGTRLIAALAAGGNPVGTAFAARSLEGLRSKIDADADATPVVHVAEGVVWLER